MDNNERIKLILKQCGKGECFGCPLRQTRECTRSMAIAANQEIMSLEKQIKTLEKRNAELEERIKSKEV